MATVTINGTELDSDDPRAVRKALDKARREEKKRQEQENADWDRARDLARIHAYSILSRKASGERLHWTFSGQDDRYRPFRMFHDGSAYKTWLESSPSAVLSHYGTEFVGAIWDGGGVVRGVFLCDCSTRKVECHGIGVCGNAISLADCPGVSTCDFERDKD